MPNLLALTSVLSLVIVGSLTAQEQEKEKKGKKPALIHCSFRSATERTITVIRGDEGERVYDLHSIVEVLIDGKPGKIEDIPVKTALTLELIEGHDKVAEIRATGPSERGRLESVDVAAGTITLAGEDKQVLKVAADAKLQVDGVKAALGDLRPGQEVHLQLSVDRKTAFSVVQKAPRGEEGGKGKGKGRGDAVFRAVIVAVDAAAKTLTLAAGEDGKERVLSLAADCKVTVDGAAATLADVKASSPAAIRLGADRQVLEITLGGRKKSGGEEKE